MQFTKSLIVAFSAFTCSLAAPAGPAGPGGPPAGPGGPTPAPAPSSASGCVPGQVISNGFACTSECNVDRKGGDYASLHTTWAGCISACSSGTHCVTAQYDHTTGYCYLKNFINPAVASTTVNSITCQPPFECPKPQIIKGRTCTSTCQHDRPGGNWKEMPAVDLETCIEFCGDESKCVSAQFDEADEYCYLKNVTTPLVASTYVHTVDCQ